MAWPGASPSQPCLRRRPSVAAPLARPARQLALRLAAATCPLPPTPPASGLPTPERGGTSLPAAAADLQADYVVIGAGSAGCVVASRLSQGGASVLLLEAGPTDWHPMIHIPAGVLKLLYNPLVNWNYATDPEPGIAGRQIHWPRGRVLGGSSSINGMLWIRGNPTDYDAWSQMGCNGWSFEEVLPYFKSIERYADRKSVV